MSAIQRPERRGNRDIEILSTIVAMAALAGKELGGAGLEISLAKPPSDKKKKEDMLRYPG